MLIPRNVNNNCSTGSTALFQARQLIEGGIVDCALALGFERMAPGSLVSVWNDRANPVGTCCVLYFKNIVKHFTNFASDEKFFFFFSFRTCHDDYGRDTWVRT